MSNLSPKSPIGEIQLVFVSRHIWQEVSDSESTTNFGKCNNTGGIERFSAREIFEKILKVSHFYLGFSLHKNNNQIKHIQRVSLEFSELASENLDKSLKDTENSDKML